MICDREILSALRIASKKGVDVRIITPHIPDKKTVFLMTRSNYKELLEDNVKIYEYSPGFIHAKNYICDDKFAVHHFECGAWMYDTDCIAEMKSDFLDTLTQSGEIRKDRAVMRSWQRLIAEIMKVFSPLF